MKKIKESTAIWLSRIGYFKDAYNADDITLSYEDGQLVLSGYTIDDVGVHLTTEYVPYYLEIWVWLWKNKGYSIDVTDSRNKRVVAFGEVIGCSTTKDPEEAIINVIDGLANMDFKL